MHPLLSLCRHPTTQGLAYFLQRLYVQTRGWKSVSPLFLGSQSPKKHLTFRIFESYYCSSPLTDGDTGDITTAILLSLKINNQLVRFCRRLKTSHKYATRNTRRIDLNVAFHTNNFCSSSSFYLASSFLGHYGPSSVAGSSFVRLSFRETESGSTSLSGNPQDITYSNVRNRKAKWDFPL